MPDRILDKEEFILEVKDLKTHFSTQDGILKAVNGVSFNLRRGEIIGIVGESGSGKSVSVMSILQLIPKPAGKIVNGEVLFRGQDLCLLNDKQLKEIRGNKISMIFQDPMTSLNPYMKVSHQIMETLIVHKQYSKKEALERAIELLTLVGINDVHSRIHNYPHQFSGGMRQRVMIAMALACEPDILIADEPTTALDVSVQIQILELIKELAQKLHTAVILITHDLGVVAHMCDRVYVMYAGRIVEKAGVDNLFEMPAHPYTQGLIHSVTQLHHEKKEALEVIQGQPPVLVSQPKVCLFHPRCKKAGKICRESRPSFEEIKKDHWVECHYPQTDNKPNKQLDKHNDIQVSTENAYEGERT